MALTTEQVTWVQDATGVQSRASEWKLQLDKKVQVLDGVRRELDLQRRELQELLKFTLALKDKGQIPSSLGDMQTQWGADEELDTTHDVRKLAKSLPPDIEKRARRAIDVLNGFSSRLEKAGFTDKEIRVEYWDPLKREGICPDNFIPDRFNETVQVFREADKYYQQRQKAAKKEKEKAYGDVKFGLDKVTTIVSSLNSAFGGPELLTTISDYTKTIGKATVTIVEGIVEKDCQSVADAVGEVLKESIKAAGVRDDKIAVLVQKSFSLAMNAGKLGKAAAEKKPTEFFQVLGDAVGDAFAIFDRGNREETPWGTLGTKINLGIQAAVDLGTAGVCLKNRDWAGLSEVAQAAVSRSITGSLELTGTIEKRGEAMAEKKAEKSEKSGKPMTEKQIEQFALNQAEDISGRIEGVVGEKGSLATMFTTLNKVGEFADIEKEFDAKENEKIREALANELDESNHDFENELNEALEVANMDPSDLEAMGKQAQEKAENSIEKMIQKIEKVRATLKIAEAIFDTGMKTAAEFFEPLKIASAGKDFAKNVILAVKQGVELNKWVDKVEAAATAASVYGKTFANRVKNLRVQISEKTAHAVCDLLKIVGGGLTCGVITAPVGIIVGKVGSAAQAGSDIAFELAKRVDARNQWAKYRECLDLPPHMTDRKLMREILHGNATLAKYALAYGAVIEKDRIAISGMKLCGLTEANLNEEGTNVKLVVKYLESKFDEDPVLVQQIPEQAWQSKSETLSLSVFKADLKKAEKATRFINEKTGAIEGAFGQVALQQPEYETVQRAFQKQREAFEPVRLKYETALGEREHVFDAYRRSRQLYRDALEKYRKLAAEEEKRQAEVDFRKEYYQAMNVVLGFIGTLQPKAEACEPANNEATIATRVYFSQATTFVEAIEPYLKQRDALATALRRLGAEMAMFAPLKKKSDDEDEQVPDDSVRAYLNTLRQKAASQQDQVVSTDPDLAETHKELQTAIDRSLDAAETRQSELTESQNTLKEIGGYRVELEKKAPLWKD